MASNLKHAAMRTEENGKLLFLPALFNETLALLFDAHQHFQNRGAEELAAMPDDLKLPYTEEMTRITLRLTNTMAWIMVKRAVHAGRIDASKANDESYGLGESGACLHHRPKVMVHLPYYLNYLSERSLALYQRAHRLDNMERGA